eukprot:scaffold58146_cov16-Tisochrysis_lutea.AAC.1
MADQNFPRHSSALLAVSTADGHGGVDDIDDSDSEEGGSDDDEGGEQEGASGDDDDDDGDGGLSQSESLGLGSSEGVDGGEGQDSGSEEEEDEEEEALGARRESGARARAHVGGCECVRPQPRRAPSAYSVQACFFSPTCISAFITNSDFNTKQMVLTPSPTQPQREQLLPVASQNCNNMMARVMQQAADGGRGCSWLRSSRQTQDQPYQTPQTNHLENGVMNDATCLTLKRPHCFYMNTHVCTKEDDQDGKASKMSRSAKKRAREEREEAIERAEKA